MIIIRIYLQLCFNNNLTSNNNYHTSYIEVVVVCVIRNRDLCTINLCMMLDKQSNMS